MKTKRQQKSDDVILRSSDIPPALLQKLTEIAEQQQRPVKKVIISLVGRLFGFHLR